MSNKKYSGNNIGDYPLTIAEKVVVPSERKLLSEMLSEVDGKVSDLIEKTTPVEAADITALMGDQLDALEVGDKVAKKTGTAEHVYVCTYKDAENGGICLTYTDASVVETVSYDHTSDGWVYNSTDTTSIGGGPSTGLKVIVSTADWALISGEGVTANTKAEAAQIAGLTEDELDFLLNGGDLTPCLFVFGTNGGDPNNYSYYTKGVRRGHDETGGVGFTAGNDEAPSAVLSNGVYTIYGFGE